MMMIYFTKYKYEETATYKVTMSDSVTTVKVGTKTSGTQSVVLPVPEPTSIIHLMT